ncbi:MAG: flippase [Chloroflexi bacterium]|nr:MAG: flippase [Chloroflexota bacterium]TME20276.1 MAG: flippase [Chloroflexota bacterium]
MEADAESPVTPVPGGLGSRALRNTALLLGARVVSRLLALVTFFGAAASLGAAGTGRFQTGITLMSLVSVVVDLGFNNLYVREAARNPQELSRYLRNVLSSRAVLAVAGFLALAAVLAIYGLESLLAAAFATMVLNAYANVLRSTFYATGRLGYEAIAIVVEAGILVSLTLLGVRLHMGVAYYLWAYAASYAFSCVFFSIVIAARRIARLGWQLEPAFLLHWLRLSLPFAATFVITTIYFKSDLTILPLFRPYQEVGWYGFAYKPFEALLFIPVTMLNVVFPVLGVYFRASVAQLQVAINRFYKALFAVGWPASVGVVLLAPGINALFDRTGHFGPATPALQILGSGIFLMFITNAFIGALNAADRQHLFMWTALASMVANVALNLALIPSFGYLGAAWATNLTELVLLVVGWAFVAREIGRVPVFRLSWRIALAGAVMGAALLPFRSAHGLEVLGAILVGVLVYGVALVLVRAFDAEEIAIARRALPSRAR